MKKIVILVLSLIMMLNCGFTTSYKNENTTMDYVIDGEANEDRHHFSNEEYNPSLRQPYPGYTRDASYILLVNDNQTRYAYSRKGYLFYTPTEVIDYQWENVDDAVESVDIGNQLLTVSSERNIYCDPFEIDDFKIGVLPTGSYKATKQAYDMAYVETGYGNGWISTSGCTFNYVKGYFSDSSANGVPIHQKIIPENNTYTRPGVKIKPTYVTIHNTAAFDAGANALAHANLQYNGNPSEASWHFQVDDHEIWQSLPMDEEGYHAGDYQMQGNSNTIAIEICENADGNYYQAEINAAKLTAKILHEQGLPADAVKMHKDWMGKNCPHNMLDGTSGSMGWNAFLNLVKSEYNKLGKITDYTVNSDNHIGQNSGKDEDEPTLSYQANSCIDGWQEWVNEPNSAGTTGRNLDLYQLKFNFSNVPNSMHLSGKVFIKDQGYAEYSYINNQTIVGTNGKALQKVMFNLENINGYKLYYRVHSADIGWLDWVEQGSETGIEGKNIQAIDFKLIRDESIVDESPHVFYESHVSNIGWMGMCPEEEISGYDKYGIEAIRIGIDGIEDYQINGSVYVNNEWVEFKNIQENTVVGTTGKGLNIKAVKFNLINEEGYTLEYSTRCLNEDWGDWKSSDEISGDSNYIKSIAEIRFRLVWNDPTIHTVEIEPSSLSLKNNEEAQLTAKIYPNNTLMDKSLSWSSSNPSIVEVDQTGKISAKQLGSAVITATSVNGVIGSCMINVIIPIEQIVLNHNDLVLNQGNKEQLKATILPEASTEDKTLIWKSNNESIVKVDQMGNVEAIDVGEATITVTSLSGKSDSCHIQVNAPLNYIKADTNNIKLYKNETKKINIIYYPSNTTDDKSIKWSSDHSDIATVDENGVVTGHKAGTTTVTALASNGSKVTINIVVNNKIPQVIYQDHVANIGWGDKKESTSGIIGTTGKNLGLEAVKLDLDTDMQGSIEYCSHVANEGWQKKVTNYQISGTTGKARSIEAVSIKLTGDISNYYSIYYRAHVQNVGWLPWTKDGNIAGSTGKSLQLEAIEFKLIEKDTEGPVISDDAYLYDVSYGFYGHVSDIGWMNNSGNNGIIGTTGKAKSLEAIRLNISDSLYNGNIEYRAYSNSLGWQNWVKNGQVAGTTGKAMSMEAVQVRLTGGLAEKYDIYYRAHVADFGWLAWTKNGEYAGTEGYNKRLEAIEIRVVKKGTGNINTDGESFKKYVNTPPTISNVSVSNITSNGYTVTCQVDALNTIDKVLFPTWTVRNGQDDITWEQGVVKGNKVTFTMDVSNHGNESGDYVTHIYAYDKKGLVSNAVVPTVTIETNIFNKGQYADLQKGCDISQWQSGLDLANVKDEIDFAILRIGYTKSNSNSIPTLDPCFETFYNQAGINNIPIGVYFYSNATDVAKAVEEAQFVIDTLKNRGLTYPVFFDFEDDVQQDLPISTKEAICNAFCMKIKEAGYKAGIYSRKNFLFDDASLEFKNKWELWVANYGNNNGQPTDDVYKFKSEFDLWQYTNVGSLKGYNGNIDLSVSYKKY